MVVEPRSLSLELSVIYWVIAAIFFGFGVLVLLRMFTGSLDLTGLISESDSYKASLSRFQMLLFTFVVAGIYLVLCLESGTLLDVPGGVLTLLGISSGGYVLSKGISSSSVPKVVAMPPTGAGGAGGGAGGVPGPAADGARAAQAATSPQALAFAELPWRRPSAGA